jgi:predicted RNA-binding protein associated with RNAse of E/G family
VFIRVKRFVAAFMLVTIHYTRPGKSLTLYTEGLVSDDGHCLHTYTVLPDEIRRDLSQALRRDNLIAPTQTIASIRKRYFYAEPFNLLEFWDTENCLAGYYSDLTTLMVKRDDGYHLTDLFLDIWLTPEGTLRELDWDEFEEAVEHGVLTDEQQALARGTMARLVSEVADGQYPTRYLC